MNEDVGTKVCAVLERHSQEVSGLLDDDKSRQVLFDFLYAEARLRVAVDLFEDAVQEGDDEEGAKKRFEELMGEPVGQPDEHEENYPENAEDRKGPRKDAKKHGIVKRGIRNLSEKGWGSTVFSKLNGIIKKIAGGGDE